MDASCCCCCDGIGNLALIVSAVRFTFGTHEKLVVQLLLLFFRMLNRLRNFFFSEVSSPLSLPGDQLEFANSSFNDVEDHVDARCRLRIFRGFSEEEPIDLSFDPFFLMMMDSLS